MKKIIKTAFQLTCILYAISFIVISMICVIISLFIEMSFVQAMLIAIKTAPKLYLAAMIACAGALVVVFLIRLAESVVEKYEEVN